MTESFRSRRSGARVFDGRDRRSIRPPYRYGYRLRSRRLGELIGDPEQLHPGPDSKIGVAGGEVRLDGSAPDEEALTDLPRRQPPDCELYHLELARRQGPRSRGSG